MYGSSDHVRRKILMVPDHIHDQKIVEDKRKIPKDRRMDSIAVDAKGSQSDREGKRS